MLAVKNGNTVRSSALQANSRFIINGKRVKMESLRSRKSGAVRFITNNGKETTNWCCSEKQLVKKTINGKLKLHGRF